MSILSLPDEILYEVFKTGSLLSAHESMMYALRVSLVCGRWRRVALSAKKIWSVIAFATSDYLFDSLLLPVFLERAKDYPLRIVLRDTRLHGPYTRSVEAIRTVGAMLREHRDHIQAMNVKLCGNSVTASALLRQFQSFSSESLEILEIQNADESSPGRTFTIEPSNIFSGNLPKLTQVYLENVFWPESTVTSIRYLHLMTTGPRRWSSDELTHLLVNSPMLEKLVIDRAIPWPTLRSLEPEPMPRSCPRLETLGLVSDQADDTNASTFLISLNAPSLRRLFLYSLESRAWAPFNSYLENRRPIYTSVTELQIDYCALCPIFANAFPNLQCIAYSCVDHPPSDSEDSMACDQQWAISAWPELRTITLRRGDTPRALKLLNSFVSTWEAHYCRKLQARRLRMG